MLRFNSALQSLALLSAFSWMLTAVTVVGAASSDTTPDLTELMTNNKNLTSFNALIRKYGDIYATLSFEQDVTILAPSDDAFNKLPYSSLNEVFEKNDTDTIRALLHYHVLNGTHTASSFNGSFQFIPTHLYNSSYSNVTGGAAVSIVKQAGDVIVAVSGEGSRSTLTTTDLQFTGGILHVIDSFLVLPETFVNTASTFNLTSANGAMAKANLEKYLDTTTDITIFAPWNDAFQEIGTAFQNLTVEELASLMSYHIVNGTVAYTSLMPNGTELKSLQGTNLTVRFAANSWFINSAKIIQSDLLLANGVLHVLDNSVLDYHGPGAFPNPVIPTQPPLILGSSVPYLPFSTDVPKTASSFSSASSTASGSGASKSGSAATSTGNGMGAATSTSSSFHSTETGKKKSSAPMPMSDKCILSTAFSFVLTVLML
ncbi:FAS1 domain-containing protein [Xylona heveae TC161]|uniref:FAS1 domain-containing protein n=1 Tax=Xylona heveae (strain CBS 132557 / TC161) TaxID=1328760 RepID=A0A165FZY9_XYLHT|nr:FAS1 domain-containing protein [Xylona heveae TC161]KZF21580.1 FAS1 domain-containing protein [Xylona heveae TC161]